jgi:hypothetical protein
MGKGGWFRVSGSGFLVKGFLGGGATGHHHRFAATHVVNQRAPRRTDKRARPAFNAIHKRERFGPVDVIRLDALAQLGGTQTHRAGIHAAPAMRYRPAMRSQRFFLAKAAQAEAVLPVGTARL